MNITHASEVVAVEGPGGPMECSICCQMVPDRFTGTAFGGGPAGEPPRFMGFICAECTEMHLLIAVYAASLVATLSELPNIYVWGPVYHTGKTHPVWARYHGPEVN